MLRLFRKRRDVLSTESHVPTATRVYAIGDIHGCLYELEELLGRIGLDIGDYAGDVMMVFVGDLIDRGPSSAGVIDCLMHLSSLRAKVHVLMGNHEESMLAVYDGAGDARAWLTYGGLQTLESYGLDRAEHFASGFDPVARMRGVIPAAHIEFLRGLPDQVQIGDYLFVHAGIRPGIAIGDQNPTDLRWIRNDFLASEADHGVTVVHGHTIAPTPQSLSNRIGIDTGCYAGGPLTALVLEGGERRFLQVEGYTG